MSHFSDMQCSGTGGFQSDREADRSGNTRDGGERDFTSQWGLGIRFELYNTDTEVVEATQEMTAAESLSRNKALRRDNEPQRWIAAR